MKKIMIYVGAYWSRDPTILENPEAVHYCLRQLFYLYKERLESLIRQLPYTDRRLDDLLLRYPAMYKRRKNRLLPEEYPIEKRELEGQFVAYFYDDVRMRLVEQRMEIENYRYYFINYCKKRKYQVTDDFYDCILQDGEVILSKIAPSFRELIPIDFLKKCHLRILP
ncbi:TPA: hypothetical protein ACU3VQ_001603 [Enterococcus faecalis]